MQMAKMAFLPISKVYGSPLAILHFKLKNPPTPYILLFLIKIEHLHFTLFNLDEKRDSLKILNSSFLIVPYIEICRRL